MSKYITCLLGAAVAALMCAASANAQDYDDQQDGAHDAFSGMTVLGRIDGEIDPQIYSESRQVDFSDLDLSRGEDYMVLRGRVADTARELCAELEARVPALRGEMDAERECVHDATRKAMRDVRERFG